MSRKYEVFWSKLMLRIALTVALMTPWIAGMITLNLALASFGIGLMAGVAFGRFDAPLSPPVIRRIEDHEEDL